MLKYLCFAELSLTSCTKFISVFIDMVSVGMQVYITGVDPMRVVIVFHPLATGKRVDVLRAHPGTRQDGNYENKNYFFHDFIFGG